VSGACSPFKEYRCVSLSINGCFTDDQRVLKVEAKAFFEETVSDSDSERQQHANVINKADETENRKQQHAPSSS
jgi:hypothetical protein